MGTDDVYVFEIAPEDFDAGLLPEPARQTGSPGFKDQVRRFFERNLDAFAGWHDISVEDDKIRVSWKASPDKADALSEIIKKLRDGEYQEGIQLLRFLLPSREKDAAVHYNLGMALSDTGGLDEAEEHLRKAVEIDPDFTEAKVALGVAPLPEAPVGRCGGRPRRRRGGGTRQSLCAPQPRSLPPEIG